MWGGGRGGTVDMGSGEGRHCRYGEWGGAAL